MAIGCFYVSKNEDIEYDIVFAKNDSACNGEIPEEQVKVYEMSEDIVEVIKSLINSSKQKKDEYFEKLLSNTQVGLVGENAQPEIALKGLKKLKVEMVASESGRIKNYYMMKLGMIALSLICLSGFIVFIINNMHIFYLNKYFFVFQGAMVGAWISFGARKVELKFEELSKIEVDLLNPLLRLIFIGICSIVLYLFFSCGIISFKVGSFTSEILPNSIEAQYLLGTLCGLIEYKIAVNIYNKADSIIKF
ncbi:hypothetical protein M4I33_10575 [Clostridium sp. LY3-2]|uniref:hypothetical protein n=1 Tax=Clostridium sp. LY3-2 TaxID=2942482 RepID=UPI002152095F|nr:hypothetical protein [Clostridium sp. LY3-2]MCR6515312.1 hypothetical protein [Clostridium sp. LY3-2]